MSTATSIAFVKSSLLGDNCDRSFTEKLLETRRNEIKAFSIALRDEGFLNFISTPEGDHSFCEFIELAIREYGVSQREVATATNATPSTISRWMSGQSMPPRYARKSIVEAIAMIIDHNLDL
jgi:ribosome-binding protein aMBF1 (putative translation factor)